MINQLKEKNIIPIANFVCTICLIGSLTALQSLIKNLYAFFLTQDIKHKLNLLQISKKKTYKTIQNRFYLIAFSTKTRIIKRIFCIEGTPGKKKGNFMTSGIPSYDPTKGVFHRGDIVNPEKAEEAKKKEKEAAPIPAPPKISEEEAPTDAVRGSKGGRRPFEKPIQVSGQAEHKAPPHHVEEFRKKMIEQSFIQGNAPITTRPKAAKKESIRVETATFAGGCFWCLQDAFDSFPGVLSTTVGYTGGSTANPTYKDVCGGKTGHVEAIEVVYDPQKITFQQLLEVYWHSIDPSRGDGQFCDIGPQYRPIIFYHNETQRQEAIESKVKLLEAGALPRVMVDIAPAPPFYFAEDYHQKYYDKSYSRYELYYSRSGRSKRLKEIWGEKK
jgi:peptide-methionine (S)-S-oxide reductase